MQHTETETTTSGAAAHAAETSVPVIGTPTKSRVIGVDATRGLALLAMMAVHVFPDFNVDGTPSMTMVVAAGRSVATFALLAGVSLALMTGGRHPLGGRTRTAAAAGLAVRALLIGFIGLALGYSGSDVNVILPYYGVLFLLAIPLIGLRPRVLACMAIVIALVVPVFTLVIGDHLPHTNLDDDLTFGSLLHPYRFAVELLITGLYPALPFMAYICAGLAIGRLKLASTRVAARLLGGGLALAVSAWVTSSMLLLHLDGLQQLRHAALPGTDPNQLTDNALLWSPPHIWSWWWLAVRAPYSATPIELLHTIGVAMAVLGAMLLLSRVAASVLGPLAVMGSMILTIYCAHVVYLSFDPLSDYPFISYIVQVATAFVFAVIWRRAVGRGPLETVIAVAAGRVRKALAARIPAEDQRQAKQT
jgi:uncharacterized membrane protein